MEPIFVSKRFARGDGIGGAPNRYKMGNAVINVQLAHSNPNFNEKLLVAVQPLYHWLYIYKDYTVCSYWNPWISQLN